MDFENKIHIFLKKMFINIKIAKTNPVDDASTVDILETPQHLIHQELNVVVC